MCRAAETSGFIILTQILCGCQMFQPFTMLMIIYIIINAAWPEGLFYTY